MKNSGGLNLYSSGRNACVLLSVCALLWPAASFAQQYEQTNLIKGGDAPGLTATKTDANLVNPWGLARSTNGPWWIANNGTGTSTLYNGGGETVPLVVTIPGSPGASPGNPTGIVFNGSQDFALQPDKPALFLFVAEDGSVSGWNPDVPAANSTTAITKVPGSAQSVLKGATIAQKGESRYLYVADFRQGKVKVYDTHFQQVWFYPWSFVDSRLPQGFAPFNVQNIGGNLYVAFAKQDEAKHDEVDGPGLGVVDVFSPDGCLLCRLEGGAWFNAPWGLAQAPGDFGSASHKLLVGQFGSGEILIFDPVTGRFAGKLHGKGENAVQIQGLWGISFGSGTAPAPATASVQPSGPANVLFFTAGVNGEAGGLFGTLSPAAEDLIQGSDQ
ncbi:MAG TPA: TIGR03118 family protein [Chthoniobacterales bacterium]